MTTASSPNPVETILGTGLRRLLMWGVPLSLLGLIYRSPGPDAGLWAYSLIHLGILQAVTFLYAIEIAELTDDPWFRHLKRPWIASTASLVAAVVGFSALLTLATSAAVGYAPSLQFLQLLSSLDIAWVVATLYIGTRKLANNRSATLAGLGLIGGCIWSIAVYLSEVGFTQDGGWLVDGAQLMRIVLPVDTLAAVISLTVLLLAAKKADQRTVHERLQS